MSLKKSELQRSSDNDTPSLQSVKCMSLNNSFQLEVLQVISQIQKDMKKLHSNDNDDHSSNAKFRSKKRKANKSKYRPNTSRYCWSCGAWNQVSKNCQFKTAGHKDEDNFKNMMYRSIEFYQVYSEWRELKLVLKIVIVLN